MKPETLKKAQDLEHAIQTAGARLDLVGKTKIAAKTQADPATLTVFGQTMHVPLSVALEVVALIETRLTAYQATLQKEFDAL